MENELMEREREQEQEAELAVYREIHKKLSKDIEYLPNKPVFHLCG